ncbi:MAG TPA: HAD family phosphatase [Gemmataceae bacterium]|jgi:beta-phosphoglucomutase|nr:HAD family phosphatase [Gemmataceae bacterium]
MPTEPMAVIWDVDGTLVDTAAMHFAAWARLAGEMGWPFSQADFATTFGRRNPEIIRFLFREDFTDAEVARIGETKEGYYRSAAEQGTALLPGVRELLDGFRARGVRQAVGSSAPGGNLDLVLRITESKRYFDAIVGMEDTQRGKPDPEVFLVAASRLGVSPSRCVVLEDAIAGVEAARAGGMKCVGVTFVGHHPAEKLKAAGADRVVKCFTEITADDVLALLK